MVSGAVSSTRGENDCAQSSSAACAAFSCNKDRVRNTRPAQASTCNFVMPGFTPARRPSSFTAKTFCNGALPSSTTSGCIRNAGSARSHDSTAKSGTKMQAKGILKLSALSKYENSSGTYGFCLECDYGTSWFLQPRTQQFTFHGKSFQKLRVRRCFCKIS